jgi:hypothetical protein
VSVDDASKGLTFLLAPGRLAQEIFIEGKQHPLKLLCMIEEFGVAQGDRTVLLRRENLAPT